MLPENTVKSVIIGALATDTVRTQIKSIVERIKPSVAVKQAMCRPDRYEIAIEPPIETETP
jgi:hypothetical protein